MLLEVGSIVEGTVTGLTSFGAFVSLPEGKSGMIHISEVSTSYVNDIREHLTEGQEVKVKIIGINDGKISLSIKKAIDPSELPQRPARPERRPRSQSNNVWQGQRHSQPAGEMTFEDMMTKFKQVSDEKISDLKKATGDARHGGYSRRGGGK